jgi:hypothetical protein
LRDALNVLDSQKQSPHGSLISYIDLSQGKRAIVGLTSGVHTTGDGSEVSRPPTVSTNENTAGRGYNETGTVERKGKRDRGDKSTTAEKKPDKSKNSDRSKP